MRISQKANGSLMLFLTALIWGVAFVVQRTGMDFLGPAAFQSLRMLLGSIALLPVALLRKKRLGAAYRRPSLKSVLVCGCVLGTAGVIQQAGLITTPAGKAGFISALYVVIVPVVGLLWGKRIGARGWLGIALSLIGLYLLSSFSSLTVERGEILVLISAFLFALHIIVIDRYAPHTDGVMLSCLQFLVAGLLLLPLALLREQPDLAAIWAARWHIMYAGVMSCGVAYTLQVLGQQRTPPAVASLILCLESVFSALSGALFLGERMRGRELLGCALMLCAVVISQMPARSKKSQPSLDGR